jgi:hypothetical protein
VPGGLAGVAQRLTSRLAPAPAAAPALAGVPAPAGFIDLGREPDPFTDDPYAAEDPFADGPDGNGSGNGHGDGHHA